MLSVALLLMIYYLASHLNLLRLSVLIYSVIVG